MTALTADRNTPSKKTQRLPVLVAANAKIYAGAIVAASATGFAVPGSTAATLTYLGRAEEFVDNTGGADGAQTIQVARGEAFFYSNLGADPVVQADLGKTCYIVDDQTVAHSNGGNTRSPAGKVVGVESAGVWVE
ncbi:hypothetical protein [Pseudoduganella sp. RAF53_2]|uniref:hypothetical protein n=1 Tax=unclassified Pseudoduganella TaxID=2637179 RepID=UPI003F97D9FA